MNKIFITNFSDKNFYIYILGNIYYLSSSPVFEMNLNRESMKD